MGNWGSKDNGWKTGDSGWGGKGSAAKSEWQQTSGWNQAHANSYGASHRHRIKLSFTTMTFYLILSEFAFWFYIFS
jgi:hypothetical protein